MFRPCSSFAFFLGCFWENENFDVPSRIFVYIQDTGSKFSCMKIPTKRTRQSLWTTSLSTNGLTKLCWRGKLQTIFYGRMRLYNMMYPGKNMEFMWVHDKPLSNHLSGAVIAIYFGIVMLLQDSSATVAWGYWGLSSRRSGDCLFTVSAATAEIQALRTTHSNVLTNVHGEYCWCLPSISMNFLWKRLSHGECLKQSTAIRPATNEWMAKWMLGKWFFTSKRSLCSPRP